METCSADEGKALDELSVIMNIYAERLTKARSGKKFFDGVHRAGNNLFLFLFYFYLQTPSSSHAPRPT